MQLPKHLSYLLGSTSIIIFTGFVVVLIHVIDMSAGDTWALNTNDSNSFQFIIYCIIIVVSLVIQTFLMGVSIRISFKIKKATSRLSIITRYLYVGSHLAVIISILYLMIEQVVTASYHLLLLELIVGLSLIPAVFILISLVLTTLKSFLSTRKKIVIVNAMAIMAIALQLFLAFCYIEIGSDDMKIF